MDAPGAEDYAKWNKEDKEKYCMISHMWNLVNKRKKKQTYRYREQTVATNWEREEGKGMIRIGN